MTPIDEPADPRLDDFRDLTDAVLRRRREAVRGLFVAEGKLVIRRLLRSRYPVRSLLVTEALRRALAGDLASRPVEDVFVVSQDVLDEVVGFHAHRGGFALGERMPAPEPRLFASLSRLAVIEDVNDHENLGALFRNAAALGVQGVLLSPRCCDPLYRRSVRVSVGAVLHLPFRTLEPWPAGLDDLRRAGFRLLALTPSAAADIEEVARLRWERLAILVGAEGPGLTREALAAADIAVRIPMAPGADSLNVAAASAIAFHRLAGAYHTGAAGGAQRGAERVSRRGPDAPTDAAGDGWDRCSTA